jgi:NAD(P)-dependent dehydrogenase (short-subunit alcohol dehydrogenase family)
VTRPWPARAVDAFLDRSVVLGYTTVGLRVRRALPGWPADPAPDALAGRDVLVTGASSGLGTATAEGLAALGARVHLVVLPLLAERWSRETITTAAMHPGWADTPGVQDSLPRFHALTRPLLRDHAQGADTSVWLVGTEPPPPSGRFWHDRVERPTHLLPTTRSDERQRAQAWAWLADAAGLTD